MPGTQMQNGVFLVNRGDLPGAEKAYREALYLNRQLVPAYLNLADLLWRLIRTMATPCTPWGCWRRAVTTRKRLWPT
jgi:hypothetical protein